MRTSGFEFIVCLGCCLALSACDSGGDSEPRRDAGPADAGPPLSNDLEVLNQVGVVVEDVDAVAERWQQALDIGPWVMKEASGTNAKGEPFEARFAYANVGQLELELVQITSGDTPQTDFLDESGEGLYHLGFFVDQVDRRAAQLAADGAEIVLEEPGQWAYVDSPGAGGAMLKLIERRKRFEIPASDGGISPDAFVVDSIAHVGIVVKDLEAVTLHWERTFGVDGWTIFPFTLNSVDGESVETDLAFHALGSVEIELVQVNAGTVPGELVDLGADGEGLFEIAFKVTDLPAALTKLTDNGGRIVVEAPEVAYVDLGAGGVYFELVL